MNIDTSQTKAIYHTNGPMLVVAGPGSGKTHVVVSRVRNLVSCGHISPEKILVITFTKAAASEMKRRFLDFAGDEGAHVAFGTFHSAFFSILRHEYNLTSKNIATDISKRRFIRSYVGRLDPDRSNISSLSERFISMISREKNGTFTPEKLSDDFYSADIYQCGYDMYRKVYDAYEEYLSSNHLIDFDDMAIVCQKLFLNKPDVLGKWQNRFEYILIDEFQDINPVQYETVKLLAAPKNNLFVVGDDDQSIYGFRGSDPAVMRRFTEEFKTAKRVMLTINYRSKGTIIESAKRLISNNKNRYDKEIKAYKPGTVPVKENDTRFIEAVDDAMQFKIISEIIKERCAGGVLKSDICILLRTNRSVLSAEAMLSKEGITCLCKGQRKGIYGTRVAEIIVLYINAACGDRSRRTMLCIMNIPDRGLIRESLPPEPVRIDAWKDYYASDEKACRQIDNITEGLSFIRKLSPDVAVSFIRKAVGYEKYLIGNAKSGEQINESIYILDRIEEDAKKYKTIEEYRNFLNDAAKGGSGACTPDENDGKVRDGRKIKHDAVRILTMHAAKGLEFDTVFIANVCEGDIPDFSAETEAEIEEERRLMYVAMTRAKNRLYIVSPEKVRGRLKRPSRFINEIKNI